MEEEWAGLVLVAMSEANTGGRRSNMLARSSMALRSSLRFTGRLARRKGKTVSRTSTGTGRPGFAARQTGQFQTAVSENVNKSATRNSPFALLQKSPVVATGNVLVRKGKGLSVFGGWVRFFGEVRGSSVLLYPEGHSALAGHGSSHALTDMEAHVIGLFSVAGCQMTTKGRDLIKLKREGITILLKFESEMTCDRWCTALKAATGQRVARISDFEMIAAIGKGAGGKVFLARDKRTGERYGQTHSLPKIPTGLCSPSPPNETRPLPYPGCTTSALSPSVAFWSSEGGGSRTVRERKRDTTVKEGKGR